MTRAEQRIAVLTFETTIVQPGETKIVEATSSHEGTLIGHRLHVEAFRADGRQVVDGLVLVSAAHSNPDRSRWDYWHFRKGERCFVAIRNENAFEIWVGLALIGVVTFDDSNEIDANPLRKTGRSQ